MMMMMTVMMDRGHGLVVVALHLVVHEISIRGRRQVIFIHQITDVIQIRIAGISSVHSTLLLLCRR